MVRITSTSTLKITESILLVVQVFAITYARNPTIEEVQGSLMLSGIPIGNKALNTKIFQLRKSLNNTKGTLSVKSHVAHKLKKRFAFSAV
jgi:hypothetical protein